MKTTKFLIYLILLTSCSRSLDYIPSNEKQTPIINCLFTADSTFKVYLGQTKVMYSNQSDVLDIDNAFIIDDYGKKIDLIKKTKYLYESTDTAEIGKEYTIYVNTKNFGTITANSYIPMETPSIDTVMFVQNYKIYFIMYFKDIKHIENYYELNLLYKEKYGVSGKYQIYPIFKSIEYPDNFLNFFSDQSFKDTTAYVKIKGFYADNEDARVVFVLKNLSKDYYLFYKSIYLLQQSYDIFYSFENFTNMIFVRKFSKIHTNVKGGIGIFAGYNNKCIYEIKALQ